MSAPRTPIDLGALHGLLVAAESAVEDEYAYTTPNGTPTYDNRRSVRMIVRDQALAKCAGMLAPLIAVYEAACRLDPAMTSCSCPTCGTALPVIPPDRVVAYLERRGWIEMSDAASRPWAWFWLGEEAIYVGDVRGCQHHENSVDTFAVVSIVRDMDDGIETTYPYETTSPGVARHKCIECGMWERSDKGPIAHGRRCSSRPQAVAAPGPAATRGDLARFARDVRRTATTKGRDQDTVDAVRVGFLSVSDAMNTDD